MTGKIEIQSGGELSELAKDIAQEIRGEEFGVDLEREIKHVVGLETLVQLVLDKAETLGGYDFADYDEEFDDDEDDDEDDDDEDDDEDDDRWPGDTDDDEDEESDSSPRYDGGYWTDPNDPTS